MIYEIKKIFSGFLAKLSVILLIVFIFAITIFSFSTFETGDGTYRGKAGFEYEASLTEKYKGEIDSNLINTFIDSVDLSGGRDKAMVSVYTKFPSLSTTILNAYEPLIGGNSKSLENLLETGGSDFYDRNVINIKSMLDERLNTTMSEKEKAMVIERASKIDKPYKFEYFGSWNQIYDVFSVIILISFVIIIFQISSVYSVEAENSMEILLRSLGANQVRKIIYRKIAATFALVTIEVLLVSLIFTLVSFYYTGLRGFNAPVQLFYFNSIYNYSFGQVYILIILGFLLAALAIAMITFLINRFAKRSFQAFILGLAALLLPKLLGFIMVNNNIFLKILRSMPINLIQIGEMVKSLYLGLLGNLQIFSIYLVSIFIIAITSLILILKERKL
ncbi:MAG: hypothetical protein PUI80_03225 [Peptoniphilaceae bacterium]|nr:hypothetical protein [Peptoniphilaceae bacterium]